MTGARGASGNADSLPFQVIRPCLLIAIGDGERVEVLRSPLVREEHSMYEPVRQFIAEHRLVLAARETFPDDDFMFGEVEASVYVPHTGEAVAVSW